MNLKLTLDEYYLLNSILSHILDITEEKEGVFIPNYENLMLRFPEYDFEMLKSIIKKL